MKYKLIVTLLVAMICTSFILGSTAIAANNLVPYEPTTSSSTPVESTPPSSGSSSSVPDYAGQLFQQTEIMQNEEVANITATIANVASIFITFVLGVITSVLAIIMVIDILCILIKPVAQLLAHAPIQIFSDEVIMITGIQHTGPGGQSTSIEKKDLKGQIPILFYLTNKFWTIIPAIIMLLLLGTGLLFDIIFFISNHVVSWVAGLF